MAVLVCAESLCQSRCSIMLQLSAFSTIIVSAICSTAGGQFLYPVDDNPPSDTTFSCFACEGAGCDVNRMQGTHMENSCTGARIACWTIRNSMTSSYTRMCGQPSFIRQGVFCNRHMEGKEFCFGTDTAQGRVRQCAKCCLTDRCNTGPLRDAPDPNLQSCYACDGTNQPACNAKLSSSADNSTYVEQCLLPGSDCWTESRPGGIYTRGCQLRTCRNEGFEEICQENNGETRCSTCCEGKLCNRFTNSAPKRVLSIITLLVSSCIMLIVGRC